MKKCDIMIVRVNRRGQMNQESMIQLYHDIERYEVGVDPGDYSLRAAIDYLKKDIRQNLEMGYNYNMKG